MSREQQLEEALKRIQEISWENFVGSFPNNFAGNMAYEYKQKLRDVQTIASKALGKEVTLPERVWR